MADDNEYWCRLNETLEVGRQRFEAGATFRVARSRRGPREAVLTLDGNDDSTHDWSSSLVIHDVPESSVTILSLEHSLEP